MTLDSVPELARRVLHLETLVKRSKPADGLDNAALSKRLSTLESAVTKLRVPAPAKAQAYVSKPTATRRVMSNFDEKTINRIKRLERDVRRLQLEEPTTVSGGSVGGISDAPIDGKQYGREDGAWTEIILSQGITVLAVSGSVTSEDGVDRNVQSGNQYAYAGCRVAITATGTSLTSMKVDIDISTDYTWAIKVSGSTVRSGSFSGNGLDILISVSPPLPLSSGVYYDFIFTPTSAQKFGYRDQACPIYFAGWTMSGIYFGNMTANSAWSFPLRLVVSSNSYELIDI